MKKLHVELKNGKVREATKIESTMAEEFRLQLDFINGVIEDAQKKKEKLLKSMKECEIDKVFYDEEGGSGYYIRHYVATNETDLL